MNTTTASTTSRVFQTISATSLTVIAAIAVFWTTVGITYLCGLPELNRLDAQLRAAERGHQAMLIVQIAEHRLKLNNDK